MQLKLRQQQGLPEWGDYVIYWQDDHITYGVNDYASERERSGALGR